MRCVERSCLVMNWGMSILLGVGLFGSVTEVKAAKSDIPKLINQLKSEASVSATDQLGAIGKPAIQELVKVIRLNELSEAQLLKQEKMTPDKAKEAGQQAARALSIIGAPAVDPLMALLRSPNPVVSELGVVGFLYMKEGVGAKAAGLVVKVMAKHLDIEDSWVPMYASVTIQNMGKGIYPQLLGVFKGSADEKEKAVAASFLGAFKEKQSELVPLFVEEVQKSPFNMVRGATAQALGALGSQPKRVVPRLIEALEDKDEMVRASAAGALGEFGKGAKDAVGPLKKMLNNPKETKDVKEVVKESLKQIG